MEIVGPLDGPGHPLEAGLHLGPIDSGRLGAEVEASVQHSLLGKTELVIDWRLTGV